MSPTQVRVRAREATDWLQGAHISAAGIVRATATYETAPPSGEEWDSTHRADRHDIAVLDNQIAACVAAGILHDLGRITPVS